MNNYLNFLHPWQAGNHLLVFASIFLLMIAGCVPEELTDYDFKQFQPPSTLLEDKGNVKIGEREVEGVTVALFIDKGAHAGYNRIGVTLNDISSEVQFTNASVELHPGYTIGGEVLSVPYENPISNTANEEGFFEGAALFLPPEESTGTFSLTVSFELTDGRTGSVLFVLTVEESIWMQRVDTPDGRYYVSWVHPARPEVGKNVFEVDLHREIDGGYAPLNNAEIDLYPYMDMGGGDGHSTPFEQPVFIQEGRYRGSVDFIMAGGWEMTVYIDREDATTESARFIDYRVYQ